MTALLLTHPVPPYRRTPTSCFRPLFFPASAPVVADRTNSNNTCRRHECCSTDRSVLNDSGTRYDASCPLHIRPIFPVVAGPASVETVVARLLSSSSGVSDDNQDLAIAIAPDDDGSGTLFDVTVPLQFLSPTSELSADVVFYVRSTLQSFDDT